MRSRALALPARQAFLRAVRHAHPSEVDIALCIAWEDQDRDARAETIRTLTAYADTVRPRLPVHAPLIDQINVINEFFFDELGFVGNSTDYYAAANSYLDVVVAHKTGLPITLALVYMWVANALGFTCRGVAFPGHYMVQYRDDYNDPIVIDPFRGGKRWSMSECANFLTYQRIDIPLHEVLAPPSWQATMVRVLRNLKGVYISSGDFARAASTLERMLVLDRTSAPDVRDYGLILGRLGMAHLALTYLERYLAMDPTATDRDSIRHHAKALLGQRADLS
jgi:regulator of sirC expression with transglutaminase-like and TPR domain